MKNKKLSKEMKIIYVLVALFVLIAGGLFVGGVIKGFSPQPIIKEPKVETVYVNDKGEKLENFNRKSAVNTLTEMLNEVAKDTNERTIDDRIALLDDESTLEEVFTQEAIDYLNLQDIFIAEPAGKQMTGLSLLSVTKLIQDTNNDIAPVLKEFEDAMYLDPVTQIAYIPLDIYVGRETGFSFEMAYINGQWKYVPYHLIEEVKLADIVMSKTK